jgi:hypothetical protein
MTIELIGLVVFGHHGYLEEERRIGQRFLVDLWVDVAGAATESDRIEDTVDYRRLAALVREVFGGEERLLARGPRRSGCGPESSSGFRLSRAPACESGSPTSCSNRPSSTLP